MEEICLFKSEQMQKRAWHTLVRLHVPVSPDSGTFLYQDQKHILPYIWYCIQGIYISKGATQFTLPLRGYCTPNKKCSSPLKYMIDLQNAPTWWIVGRKRAQIICIITIMGTKRPHLGYFSFLQCTILEMNCGKEKGAKLMHGGKGKSPHFGYFSIPQCIIKGANVMNRGNEKLTFWVLFLSTMFILEINNLLYGRLLF